MASLSSSLMKPISQTSNTSLNFTDHSPNSLLLPKILSFSRLGFRGRSLVLLSVVKNSSQTEPLVDCLAS
ncbi:hypothetical protein CsSME_00024101 [Camellia sinensis var. sinensis]